jgi:hypothetical protein
MTNQRPRGLRFHLGTGDLADHSAIRRTAIAGRQCRRRVVVGFVATWAWDGVSDSECVMLQSEQASGVFDLRGVENAPEILAEVAQCGAVSVLIDSVTAGKLDAGYLKLFTLSIYREESLQDAILPACQRYLGPHPREEALTSCEAMSITGGLVGSLLVDVRGELGA